ncbi:MAG: 5-methyltetrahydropteroyltriglutamate--homocysteine S-methyltransferase [Desulfobacteraceae bacterium]|jgi:methionine synthase II (cobalamin-independent)
MSISNNIGQRSDVPFRCDIVGSFLRPASIKEAREKFAEGKITRTELERVEDKEITRLVIRQKEAGLKSVTDGEFRRSYWHLDFFWGLDGTEHTMQEHGYFFHGMETRADSASLSGKIGFSEHPFLKHFSFLKKIAGSDVIPRQTIPAPAQLFAELLRDEKETEKYYHDREELCSDISNAYHYAIMAFYNLGCRNIQLDDCTWGLFCDKKFFPTGTGGDDYARQMQNLYLTLNNNAISGLPEDLTLTTHVCRGNYRSAWAASGGYSPVAKILFGKENVSAYYLEYDTERADDFSPLKEVSGNKLVVLGLVSSKTGELEDRAEIIARINEAAQYVPLERLCLSPQCGFASTEEGNELTEEQQWKKIEFIKGIADEQWR